MTMCVNVKKGLDDDADCAIAGVAMVMMRSECEERKRGLNVYVEI